jgi:hypothetical protein
MLATKDLRMVKCKICNVETDESDEELCADCYEEKGWEDE